MDFIFLTFKTLPKWTFYFLIYGKSYVLKAKDYLGIRVVFILHMDNYFLTFPLLCGGMPNELVLSLRLVEFILIVHLQVVAA